MQINNQFEIYEFKNCIILATGCFITIYSKRQFKKLFKKPLVIHDLPTKMEMNDEEWDKITGYKARVYNEKIVNKKKKK